MQVLFEQRFISDFEKICSDVPMLNSLVWVVLGLVCHAHGRLAVHAGASVRCLGLGRSPQAISVEARCRRSKFAMHVLLKQGNNAS